LGRVSGLIKSAAKMLVRIDTAETNGALCGWQIECDAVGGQVFMIALASEQRNSVDLASIFASILYFGSDFRSAAAKDPCFCSRTHCS
jgi:hypothetical protein